MTAPHRFWIRLCTLIVLLGFVASCETLSIQEEKQLGREVQASIRQQLTLLRDPDISYYLRQEGDGLLLGTLPW